ncbi:hypothetical protein [Pseudoalteromonas spongiae]|uniref:hypothetical protein n=1 Tax=Pseudoalteromonas spongiae TaxID=298657 RepID=UPI00026C9A33|nr:hypothetical protein [Pseudoalteromonas spongiae]ATC99557.1 hypothetical protein PSPO_a2642 [Pseudoalteromonas spongiae UST010723-006]
MKQLHITLSALLMTLFTSACSSTALSETMTEQELNNLEKIYSFNAKAEYISFVVKSTGCTSKDDFELLQQEAKGVYEFALKRNKADLCRAMPRAYPVTFKLPEAIDSIDLIKVLNPRYDVEAQKAAKHTRKQG